MQLVTTKREAPTLPPRGQGRGKREEGREKREAVRGRGWRVESGERERQRDRERFFYGKIS